MKNQGFLLFLTAARGLLLFNATIFFATLSISFANFTQIANEIANEISNFTARQAPMQPCAASHRIRRRGRQTPELSLNRPLDHGRTLGPGAELIGP